MLKDHADRIATDITNKLKNEIYHHCNKAMEGLEHAGVWIGNGHHAAQKMQALIMRDLEPVLETSIKTMVLRQENRDEYDRIYGEL